MTISAELHGGTADLSEILFAGNQLIAPAVEKSDQAKADFVEAVRTGEIGEALSNVMRHVIETNVELSDITRDVVVNTQREVLGE